jgi:CDGSH-type Zn-finger protein
MTDTPSEQPASPEKAEPITIRCREHGPLVIQGPCRVIDHRGNEFPLPTHKTFVALCRCGASHSKPFCDGSHKTIGFQADDQAPAG